MKFYKNFLVYWCIIYLLIAFVGRFTSSKKEYFPFFRWSLYSKTPNSLDHAYILVEKIGDSTLNPPEDIRNMFDYHHVKQVDMNLIVQEFYTEVKNNGSFSEHIIFNAIPRTSTFKLFETKADLSVEDYKKTIATNQLLTFKNDNFYFE